MVSMGRQPLSGAPGAEQELLPVQGEEQSHPRSGPELLSPSWSPGDTERLCWSSQHPPAFAGGLVKADNKPLWSPNCFPCFHSGFFTSQSLPISPFVSTEFKSLTAFSRVKKRHRAHHLTSSWHYHSVPVILVQKPTHIHHNHTHFSTKDEVYRQILFFSLYALNLCLLCAKIMVFNLIITDEQSAGFMPTHFDEKYVCKDTPIAWLFVTGPFKISSRSLTSPICISYRYI